MQSEFLGGQQPADWGANHIQCKTNILVKLHITTLSCRAACIRNERHAGFQLGKRSDKLRQTFRP